MAQFYEHATDMTPCYRVPLKLLSIDSLSFFREHGFTQAPDTAPGEIAFCRVVNADELPDWTRDDAVSDIMCILEQDIDEEHIVLSAYEMKTMGSNSKVPKRYVQMGDTRVYFFSPDPLGSVNFVAHKRQTNIPLFNLKKEFNAITMMEVYDALEKMANEKDWTYDEIVGHFSHLSENPEDISPKCYAGDTYVEFTTDDPWAPVIFTRGNEEFRVPYKKMCDYSGEEDLTNVCCWLVERYKDSDITFEQLKDFWEGSIDDAIDLALHAFFGEKDLDGNPAILHALAVGLAGNTKHEKIVGFLHDVIEDTDWTMKDIRCCGFAPEVQEAIALLTHDKERMSYEDYIMKIINSGNTVAINVKQADLQHNIERGKSGGHQEKVAKHEKALALIEGYLKLRQE